MLRILSTFVVLFILLGAPVRADDQVTTFTLDNGMDIVVIEDHRAPVVTHMIWYRAGAADERPGISGVAHFLEHLMFKSTKTLDSGEFSATVARNGGSDNAFTSYDYTAYFQRIAADRLDLMMRMESDRMVNLKLSQDDIETERDVIIEERNQRVENDPGSLFREQMSAAQYLNHPYGVPIIGWQREMQTLGLDQALDYYRTNYAPNNAILVVAGDVDPDQVHALAKTHYGPIPANRDLPERTRPQEPRQMAERRLVFEDARVAQPYVLRSYLAPARDSGAQQTAAALSVLSDLLGDGTNSVLTQKLEFESKVSLYSSAWYGGTSLDDTTFNLVIVPAPGVTMAEAEAALDTALTEFMNEGVDPEHMERIKMQARASLIYARDNVGKLAQRYGSALTQGLSVADVQNWPDDLQAVTQEDVMAAARQVLVREHSVTGWLKAPEVTQ